MRIGNIEFKLFPRYKVEEIRDLAKLQFFSRSEDIGHQNLLLPKDLRGCFAVKMITDCVFQKLSGHNARTQGGGTSPLLTITHSAGDILYMKFKTLQMTSGVCKAYFVENI